MSEFITTYEIYIRLSFFFGILILMAIWEMLAPKRALTTSKLLRWLNNLGLVVLNSLILRWLFPAATVGLAILAHQAGWGLLNYYQLPIWMSIVIAVTAMDFMIYLQHVMVHAIPVLWRLHRVHHADLDYDVTTGIRFHPLEIILSMLIKFAMIIILGPPVIAVIIFEVVLNALAMFNHGNIALPKTVDWLLRWLIVTPDMHRVHHSVEDDETNSNFGFNLSCWDRIFGTYRQQPRAGHQNMTIGIHQFKQAKQVVWITGLLILPFQGKIKEYAINTRRWNSGSD